MGSGKGIGDESMRGAREVQERIGEESGHGSKDGSGEGSVEGSGEGSREGSGEGSGEGSFLVGVWMEELKLRLTLWLLLRVWQ